MYQRIRNIQLRLLPQDELLPIEVSKYDQKIVLEALHNCIAHQDYTRNGRVVVTELPDRLLFENEGSFFGGQPDEYIQGDKTPRRYRNPALAQAMVELSMIDTMGYGTHSIYAGQTNRAEINKLLAVGKEKLEIYREKSTLSHINQWITSFKRLGVGVFAESS